MLNSTYISLSTKQGIINPQVSEWLKMQWCDWIAGPRHPKELWITWAPKYLQDWVCCAEQLCGLPEVGTSTFMLGSEDHGGLVMPTPPATLTCPPQPSWVLCCESVPETKGKIHPGCKQAQLNEVSSHIGSSATVLPANLESLAGSVTSVTLDFITSDISMRVTHSLLKCIVCMSKDD